jgi:rhamnulokinase
VTRVQLAAVDLGASSGRVMLAQVDRDTLRLHAVARFGNEPVRLGQTLHWDVVELYRQALHGLRTAAKEAGPDGLAGVAVDSWAVDYGLLRDGRLLGQVVHYRDERHADGVERVHAAVPFERLYERNGLQFLPFNTVYQLAADPLARLGDGALLVPDLLGSWLTGEAVTERTNASTTGLLDVHTQDWDHELRDRLDIPPGFFPGLVDPGTVVGPVQPWVGEQIGSPGLLVTTVGSHDTASAVVGVPMTEDGAAYISCGTWGLVGVELDKPVVTAAAREANFTNEGGVDGRVRFLTNVMGTWLLSETVRAWERSDGPLDLGALLASAGEHHGDVPVFDVQDPRFVPPGDMVGRITAWCEEHDVRPPSGRREVVRSIVHSLADGFARAVDDAVSLSGRPVERVHLVGGGVQNKLLCQAVADRSGRTVVAGPVEATALGNVLVQSRTHGALTGSLEELRDLVARTQPLTTYHPHAGRMAT